MKKKLRLLIDDDSLWLLFGLLACGTFLRLFLLTQQSLWWDEGFSLINSAGNNWQENFNVVRNIRNADKFQPLYYWILFQIRHTFGSEEYVLRGASVLFGTLALPVIYVNASRFYSKRYALWSVGLATTSAFLICYSQEVRNYSLLILLSALQLYCISEVILYGKNYQPKLKWVHALLVGLGLFASIQTVVFSAGLCVSHLLANRRWREWLAWWIPAVLCALPALIYFATLPGTVHPGEVSVSRSTQPLIFNLAFVVYGVLVGTTYGPGIESLRGAGRWSALMQALPALLIFTVVSLGLAYCLYRALVRRSGDRDLHQSDKFLVYLLASSFLFGVLFSAVIGMNLVPRHAFYLWVQLPILLPIVLYRRNPKKPVESKFQLISGILLSLLIALNLYSTANYFFDSTHWRDDYRGVAKHLIANENTVDRKILFSGEAEILRYYGAEHIDRAGGQRTRMLASGDPAWLEGVHEKAGEAQSTLLIVYRPARYHQTDIRSDLQSKYRIAEEIDDFKGFKLFRLHQH